MLFILTRIGLKLFRRGFLWRIGLTGLSDNLTRGYAIAGQQT